MGLSDSESGVSAYYSFAKSANFLQLAALQHTNVAQRKSCRARSEQEPGESMSHWCLRRWMRLRKSFTPAELKCGCDTSCSWKLEGCCGCQLRS
eukprot:4246800-Amphidinium_carterae.1